MILNNYQKISRVWLDNKSSIYQYILKRTKDVDTAKEINQQVLMKMYRACHKDRDIKNIKSWLFQIAHNATIDYIKQQQKITVKPIIEQGASTSENHSIWEELAEFLDPLISFLAPKYAIPLRMYAIQGMKQADIARELNLSLSATKSRVQRAKVLLKKEIDSCCHLRTGKNGQLTDFDIKESCVSLQAFKKYQQKNN